MPIPGVPVGGDTPIAWKRPQSSAVDVRADEVIHTVDVQPAVHGGVQIRPPLLRVQVVANKQRRIPIREIVLVQVCERRTHRDEVDLDARESATRPFEPQDINRDHRTLAVRHDGERYLAYQLAPFPQLALDSHAY